MRPAERAAAGRNDFATKTARVMEAEPVAMTLRTLQTLAQVGTENNHTIIVPLPIDVLRPADDGPARS